MYNLKFYLFLIPTKILNITEKSFCKTIIENTKVEKYKKATML